MSNFINKMINLKMFLKNKNIDMKWITDNKYKLIRIIRIILLNWLKHTIIKLMNNINIDK